MKKTILSRILVLCLMLALVTTLMACGNKNDSAPEPETEEATEEETAEETEETSEAEEAAETEETEQEAAVPEELLGTQTESQYVNEYFDLSYSAPENWYLLSKEEIATVMGLAISNSDDEAFVELLKDTGYVTDFYAMETVPAIEGADAYNTLNITIQDIGKLYGTLYNEKQLAEASADTVKQTLEAQGLTDVKTEISETEFIGKNCVTLVITSKSGDIDMYQKQVYLKNGSAIAAITATTIGADKTDEVLSTFKTAAN